MINYFWIEIKGKDTKRILRQIIKKNINILNIKYYKNKIHLKVSYEEYKKIKEIKTVYEINIIKTSGKKKLFEDIIKYKITIITFILSIFFIIFLSHLTLFIEIDTNNNKLKEEIKTELNKNNITIFSMQKNYKTLNKITKEIKNKKENIEWIEIENKGVITKVKIIERVQNKKEKTNKYQDIVAEKNGYIRKIYSRKGQLLKNIDDYVKKGEVIISGNIFRNEKVVEKTRAEGKVYAEVWYIVKTNENINYTNLKTENLGYQKIILKVLEKEITLFKIKKEIKVPKTEKIFTNKVFSLYKEQEKKYTKEKAKYTDRQLINILETRAKKNILETLEKDEYIIKQKTLKKTKENDKIYLEVFFKVYENIAKENELAKIENPETEKEE